MTPPMITVRDEAWHREGILAEWLDGNDEQTAQEATDTEIAYLINHTTEIVGPGWSYHSTDGTFTGPYRGTGHNPVADILRLTQKACDYVLQTLNMN